LLLPWGPTTVIQHVLATWLASRVERVIVVVDPADKLLAELCAASGAQVVVPERSPAEMKDSVQLGLAWAESQQPHDDDAWLVAPADMPTLTAEIIDRLIAAHEAGLAAPGAARPIRAPRHRTKHGHPVLFPWPLAAEVSRLGADEGLNAIVARHGVEYVEAASDAISQDFDTPEDYDRLRARFGK